MKCSVRLMNSEDAGAWDEYVMAHPEATLYHLSGWRRVIRETYGSRAGTVELAGCSVPVQEDVADPERVVAGAYLEHQCAWLCQAADHSQSSPVLQSSCQPRPDTAGFPLHPLSGAFPLSTFFTSL